MIRNISIGLAATSLFVISALAQVNNTSFTYLAGPNFCLTNYGYGIPAFCSVPGELPLGSFPVPPVGGFYVDPNFGAKVRPLTDGSGDNLHQYSTPSAFSATGKYSLLVTMNGHPKVVATATGSVVADLTGILDVWQALWSPTDDDVMYGIGPSPAPTQIIKYQVSTGRTTILVDYARDGHQFTNITFGGTGDISPDGWVAFIAQNEHQVCAVDLNAIKTYCIDYTAPNPNNRVGWSFIDYVLITKGKDVDTNKRYVLLMALPAMGAYSVNEQTGKLDFEFRGPEHPAGVMGGDTQGVGNKDGVCDPGEACLGAPHTDVFEDNGRQYFLVDVGMDLPACEDDLVSLQISKGTNMFAPVEAGGGRKVLFTLFKCGLGWASFHVGCARSASAYCVVDFETSPVNLPTQIHDGRTAFDEEVIVMRGNGVEMRRVAMHRSVIVSYWDQPRACISQDGSMVMWDSNFGNPANHRVVVAETGFGTVPPQPGCTYTLSATSLNVGASGSSGTILATPSASTCPPPSASSNVAWATASVSGDTVSWTVAANTSSQARTGSLSIAGQGVEISQPGVAAPVTMTLFPTAVTLGTAAAGSPQSVSLTFVGATGASWTASSSQPNILVSPTSGVGNATLRISATSGAAGVVTVSAPGVANSPQTVQVQVTSPPIAAPFGSFDTPVNSTASVSAAIAVTGWALDAIEVTKVDIWRDPVGYEPPGLVYVGDAVFVPGARPDVARAFSDYPHADRAGWGYLLLTNFLPNGTSATGSGNGSYSLHALAHNRAGLVTDLGARVINVDNVHATLPFGNIDTPGQGATVFGNAFLNFGWALTPMPGAIPIDGTTIAVNVDGVTLGHPTYNQFRGDIAALFPGFANSDAAIGFFYIDTTRLANGLHTIAWNVYDNKLRGNGVGSRFFSVLNITSSSTAAPSEASVDNSDPPAKLDDSREPRPTRSLDVEEMDRIELPVGGTAGYLIENGERQRLPIGSTLQDGVFFWQLAPVYLGEYNFVFEQPGAKPTHLRVVVHPKKYSTGDAQSEQ